MPINANTAHSTGVKRPPSLDPATYPGRIVLVVDLGLQNQRPWQGQEKPPARELMLTYEFVDEFLLDNDGNELKDKPRWLSESFVLHNLGSEMAKSTKRYNALDPQGLFSGDFLGLLGMPVNVTIVHSPNKKDPSRPWENVAGVSAMRQKDFDKCPELVNKPIRFDLEEPELESFLALPNWIQKRIKENLEFNGSDLQELLIGDASRKSSDEIKDVWDDDRGASTDFIEDNDELPY